MLMIRSGFNSGMNKYWDYLNRGVSTQPTPSGTDVRRADMTPDRSANGRTSGPSTLATPRMTSKYCAKTHAGYRTEGIDAMRLGGMPGMTCTDSEGV